MCEERVYISWGIVSYLIETATFKTVCIKILNGLLHTMKSKIHWIIVIKFLDLNSGYSNLIKGFYALKIFLETSRDKVILISCYKCELILKP